MDDATFYELMCAFEESDDYADGSVTSEDSCYDDFAQSTSDAAVAASADARQDTADRRDARRAAAQRRSTAQRCATQRADTMRIVAPFTPEKLAQYERDTELINSIIPRDRFTEVVPTMFGLNGFISGVSFMEEQFIDHVRTVISSADSADQFTNGPVVRVICNYGVAYSTNYTQLVSSGAISLASEQKAARNRAKKISRRAKPRKMQGTGCCFNSSMLIWLYSARYGAVYRVLLFRTGKFGLPGMLPHRIQDAIDLINSALIPMLIEAFRVRDNARTARDTTVTAESAPAIATMSSDHAARDHAPIPQIDYLVPIVKNYKWKRILADNQTINLNAIYARLCDPECARDYASIFTIRQTYHEMCNSKMSIKFHILGDSERRIRAKIFARGRLNILGARDSEIAKKICEFVNGLITDDTIVCEDRAILTEITYFDSDTDDDIPPSHDTEDDAPQGDARVVPHVALFY